MPYFLVGEERKVEAPLIQPEKFGEKYLNLIGIFVLPFLLLKIGTGRVENPFLI